MTADRDFCKSALALVSRASPSLSVALLVGLALLTATAFAQPLASDDTAADQLDAYEQAQSDLTRRFAALAFDQASWQAFQALCPNCLETRPDPKASAAPLPQDPLGPLDVAALKSSIAEQKRRYDSELWQAASISPAGLERYKSRCLICRSQDALQSRAQDMQQKTATWQQQRSACQSAAAPRQYGGQHSWYLDSEQAQSLCLAAFAAAPGDPWAAYLLWRSQSPDEKKAGLLSYAVDHAVPPALAAAAWQRLAKHLPARSLAQRAADAGDLNGLVILALLERRDGASLRVINDLLAPALEADHPWALRLAAALEPSAPLKVAYLQLAIQQGDQQAQSQQLKAWEANLGSSRNRKLAARAHILAVAQGLPSAQQLWLENGDQRPTRLVKAVQSELIALGHLSGEPDGVWGKNSEAGLTRVSLAEVAAWQPKPADPKATSTSQSADLDVQDQDNEQAAAEQEGAIDGGLGLGDEGEPDEPGATEQDANAALEQAAIDAPLPKAKGRLAIVEPKEEKKPKPKKRGTVFLRKSN